VKALQVRTAEDLAALIVVSADTYELPLAKTATMAVDQIRSARSPKEADHLWVALVKVLRDKLNEKAEEEKAAKEKEEEPTGMGEAREEKAAEEEEEAEEEEILEKVLEWTDPVVRRGPWQRRVRIKDWGIDPADLKWGVQLSRFSEVRAEQREQGKVKEKVPDSGPSRPQHARPKEPTDSEGGDHWIEKEKKAKVEGDKWYTGKILRTRGLIGPASTRRPRYRARVWGR
jgi:hypothetical protein